MKTIWKVTLSGGSEMFLALQESDEKIAYGLVKFKYLAAYSSKIVSVVKHGEKLEQV